MTTPPGNADPNLSLLLPGYDPVASKANVAVRVTNIQTDAATGVIYGDMATAPGGTGTQAVSQGAGAAAGTAWRVENDFAEQASLSRSTVGLLVPVTDVSNFKSYSLQITGTFSATFVIEASNDGVNFNQIPVEDNFSEIVGLSSLNYIGIFRGSCSFRYLQVRIVTIASGTVNATLELYTFPHVPNAIVAQEGRDFAVEPWKFNRVSDYPVGATPITNSSGNVANASAVATLSGVANKTTYIAGFQVTGSGATLGLPVTVTVAGLISGTNSYTYCAIAGVLLGNTPLIVKFDPPVPASAVNTAIVVTCPALGSGNTNNTVSAQGYQL